MKEKKHRVEDALAATKAAVAEGVVVGGGVALIRAMRVLDDVKVDGEEKIGTNILRRALEEPLRQIAFNAGKEGSVVVEEVKKRKGNVGYNAATDVYEDLVDQGIIDPAKVTRSALEHAVWPSKKDIIKHTIIVIVISLALAGIFGVLDTAFTFTIQKLV